MSAMHKNDSLVFFDDSSDQVVKLSASVLLTFSKYTQKRCWHKEAGGQLFAKISNDAIVIQKATPPRPGDRRGRFLFWPNRVAEQTEIDLEFASGLHYVGDWHTHPQRIPKMSSTDKRNIQKCFSMSDHDLSAFLMIIVGNAPFPKGLSVSLHSSANVLSLQPETTT